MRRKMKGSLTVTLALSMILFLSFCLVLTEGARGYFFRVKASNAMDLARFSVLSEYQRELLEHYDLFFLDLDYEQGRENLQILEQRAGNYLSLNAEEMETIQIFAKEIQRASDENGAVFYRQAVEYQKKKSGYFFFEQLLENTIPEAAEDLEGLFSEHEQEAEAVLGEYVNEKGELMFDISLPSFHFPSVDALMSAVFGDTQDLSVKTLDLSQTVGKRENLKGVGTKEKFSVPEMQLFYGYLFDHFQHYGGTNEEPLSEALEYQLEYIIGGKADDKSNLEDVMWRIFLLRAGGNYLFYHQDAGKISKATAEAAAIAGAVGNPTLTGLIREMLLIVWAMEDGISETRHIFAGEKVPLYQNGAFLGISLGYREYLYLLLNVTGNREKICRSMDIVELEIRKCSGYEQFRLDHCTDSFRVQWEYGYDLMFLGWQMWSEERYVQTIEAEFQYDI